MAFSEPNGSYAYSIAYMEGWQESTLAYTGEFVVSGAPVAERVLVHAVRTTTDYRRNERFNRYRGDRYRLGFASDSEVTLTFDGEAVASNCSTGPRGYSLE